MVSFLTKLQVNVCGCGSTVPGQQSGSYCKVTPLCGSTVPGQQFRSRTDSQVSGSYSKVKLVCGSTVLGQQSRTDSQVSGSYSKVKLVCGSTVPGVGQTAKCLGHIPKSNLCVAVQC